MFAVCGGSFEREACPLSRWGGRGRRGERGGRRGGGDRWGARRNWASSGRTAAGGATRWRVRWQGLEHTATPLLDRMLKKDRDRREVYCVVMLSFVAMFSIYFFAIHICNIMFYMLFHTLSTDSFIYAHTLAKNFIAFSCELLIFIINVQGGPLYKTVIFSYLAIIRTWAHWNYG